MNVKVLRRVVGLALIAAGAWFGWSMLGVKRRPTTVATPTEATGVAGLPEKDEETGCLDGFVGDWEGDHVEAGRWCKQADGSSALEQGVLIRLEDDAGREEVTIRSESGSLPAVEGQPVELAGQVRVETPGPDPLVLESPSLSIHKQEKIVRSLQPVTFSQGDVSGRAGTLEHDWLSRVTRLGGDPEIELRGSRTGGRVVDLRADRIERRDETHSVLLIGAGSIDFGDGLVEGEQVDVTLTEDGEQVRRIEASGAARTTTRVDPGGDGPAMERVLAAGRIVHELEGESRLRAVEAIGAASLEGMPLEGELPRERLAGDDLRLEFAGTDPPRLTAVAARGAPSRFERIDAASQRRAEASALSVVLDGAGQLERLDASGGARLEDVQSDAGRRLLEAEKAALAFEGGGRVLRELDFEGRGGAAAKLSQEGAAPRTLVARKGHLVLDDEGRPARGRLEGAVEVHEPDSMASADVAEIEGPPTRTTLSGGASVQQGGRTSHGDRIVRDEGKGTLHVSGSQHTIVRDARGLPGMEAGDGSDDPIYISSNELLVEEAARKATYSGGRPALRRGDTELVADEIVIDDAAGRVDARGSVESRLRLAKPSPQPDGGAGASPQAAGAAAGATGPGGASAPGDAKESALFDPTRVVHGRSRSFHYRREDGVVSYAGEAHLEQEGASLKADEVRIGLANGTNRADWLVAEGSALFESPERQAEGRRIEYRAADGSVRVEGGRRPARARDAAGQFVSGAVVPFSSDGSVRVVSPAAGRARGSAPVTVAPPPAGS